MKIAYIYLVIAIIAEVIGTNALKASEEFTKIIPSVVVVAGYGVAFYCMALLLRTLPVGIMYALWSGLGIVLITITGAFVYKEIPDVPAVIGISLIIAGVVIINLFSKSTVH